MQPSAPLHSLPQLPQLASSDLRSTHLFLQLDLPEGQLTPHCPSLQVAVAPPVALHTVWQSPQWFTSLLGSTHVAPQAMYGDWQLN